MTSGAFVVENIAKMPDDYGKSNPNVAESNYRVQLPAWADFLRHHAALIWSPRQTVECSRCHGRGGWSGSHPEQCRLCDGTGRITRPFAPTAQPIETVRLTTLDGQEPLDAAVVYFSMEDETGKLYRFDRVKCDTCGGSGGIPNDTGGNVGEKWCPSCHGRPLNLWRCDVWPGVEFVMPE